MNRHLKESQVLVNYPYTFFYSFFYLIGLFIISRKTGDSIVVLEMKLLKKHWTNFSVVCFSTSLSLNSVKTLSNNRLTNAQENFISSNRQCLLCICSLVYASRLYKT